MIADVIFIAADFLFDRRFVQKDSFVTTAMPLWFYIKTAPVLQGIFVLMAPRMLMSSPVPWGRLATLLVSLVLMNAVHVQVATTVMN